MRLCLILVLYVIIGNKKMISKPGAFMNIRLTVTIIISKAIIKICRLANWGGTTLAGRVALKLYPEIVKTISHNVRLIMVTGTNGKTTTTRIIEQVLKENKIGYITNKSGANLLSGIITTFIDNSDIKGICIQSTALIEIDEAAFKQACNHFEPDILVVTNFFRDQLDRYGELYTTLKGVKAGIEKLNKTRLVLNADDSLCASLGKDTSKQVIYYGFDQNAHKGAEECINSDAMFCLYCKSRYIYNYHIYGHLGGFACENCGYSRPATHVACTAVQQLTTSHSEIEFTAKGFNGLTGNDGISSENPDGTHQVFSAKIKLPGLYNIYNALAAAACGCLLDLPMEKIINALGSFECGFGRMETIKSDGKTIKVILVKNPTGFNQVLNFLTTEDKNAQLAFIINDNAADGRDISWLWDVDFEKLQDMQDRLDNIFTSGLRAEDMAVRLKYAGIFTNKISIVKDYKELIEAGLSATREGHNFYILPTYTAMLEIRKYLKSRFNLKEFWK